MRKLDPDIYFSDKEIKYISHNIFIYRIKVLAFCRHHSLSIEEPSKEQVKQILLGGIEKEKEYAARKNIQFRE